MGCLWRWQDLIGKVEWYERDRIWTRIAHPRTHTLERGGAWGNHSTLQFEMIGIQISPSQFLYFLFLHLSYGFSLLTVYIAKNKRKWVIQEYIDYIQKCCIWYMIYIRDKQTTPSIVYSFRFMMQPCKIMCFVTNMHHMLKFS